MIYSVVLIDDEPHCTESLAIQLAATGLPVQVVGKFNDAKLAVSYLASHQVDLVFLDVEMPAMTGFELLEKVSSPEFDVIFVTAYDQYAIKAFTYSAINYLLKPVDDEELGDTLQKWLVRREKVVLPQQMQLLKNYLANPAKPRTRVAVPTSDGLEFLEISDIIRCESESNYTWLHLNEGAPLLVCRTLKEVEQVLQDSGFIRIHHSHLVNPQHIRKFIRHDGGAIVMGDGSQLPVSRTRKDRLFELFTYVQRL